MSLKSDFLFNRFCPSASHALRGLEQGVIHEEINIKSDAKKDESYEISKNFIALHHCNFSANSLALITQLLLCQNMLYQK